jgi:Zn-dependent protease
MDSGFRIYAPIFPNLFTIHYWIMGIAGAIILFVSVLLHELAHSLLLLKYGLEVRQIILFILEEYLILKKRKE